MIGITWTLCWWLINYSPYNLVAQVHNLLPVRMVSKVRGASQRQGAASCADLHAEMNVSVSKPD